MSLSRSLAPALTLATALALAARGASACAEEQHCNLGTTGDSGGAEGPWLELYNGSAPLADGQTLGLVLGGQGFCMFELPVYVGGYEPTSEYSDLDVTLDIEGLTSGADGHTISYQGYQTFIGCEDPRAAQYDGFELYVKTVQLIAEDWSDEQLEGKSARLSVTMNTPAGERVTVAADLVIATNDCGSGY